MEARSGWGRKFLPLAGKLCWSQGGGNLGLEFPHSQEFHKRQGLYIHMLGDGRTEGTHVYIHAEKCVEGGPICTFIHICYCLVLSRMVSEGQEW